MGDSPGATGRAGAPGLSVVIPCYEAAAHVEATVRALTDYLERLPWTWEVVLVDDGSRDGTADVLADLSDGARTVFVSLQENRGKGRAVAEGMTRARGACRMFTDHDLPYRLDAVPRCAELVLERGHPVVFGNRLLAESEARMQSRFRRWAGAGVRRATRRLLGRADVDTQCGFKGFSAAAAEALFPLLRIDGFLFDVEATVLLQRAGVPITFLPVELVNQNPSTVQLMRTGALTLGEAWRIWRDGRRDDRDLGPLRALVRAPAPGYPPPRAPNANT